VIHADALWGSITMRKITATRSFMLFVSWHKVVKQVQNFDESMANLLPWNKNIE
jgi:hypothetical protein